MSLEADCPYCGRAVGVLQRLNIGSRGGGFGGFKLSVHSAGAPNVGARRPRCEFGSGLEVDRKLLREVPVSAANRKRAQERAARKAATR